MKSNPRAAKIQRGFLYFVLLVLAVVAIAAGYDAYANTRLPADFPAPGQFVKIGAAKMHYVCQGSGEPTIVLEAGINGGYLDWSTVMSALAAHNRVCAFDRLGQDWSDPAPHPRVFSTAADELHTALQAIGIQSPIVVGHSLGGALVQVYAAKYDTEGVILVEGLTSDVVDNVVERLGSYQSLDPLARVGLLRPLGMLFASPGYPAETRSQMIALRSGSTALQNISDEGAVAKETGAAELRAAEPRIDVPMLIIAAEQSDVPGLPPGAFAAAAKALAGRKTGSTYVLVPNSKHYVQADQPRMLVAAIANWLASPQ